MPAKQEEAQEIENIIIELFLYKYTLKTRSI